MCVHFHQNTKICLLHPASFTVLLPWFLLFEFLTLVTWPTPPFWFLATHPPRKSPLFPHVLYELLFPEKGMTFQSLPSDMQGNSLINTVGEQWQASLVCASFIFAECNLSPGSPCSPVSCVCCLDAGARQRLPISPPPLMRFIPSWHLCVASLGSLLSTRDSIYFCILTGSLMMIKA